MKLKVAKTTNKQKNPITNVLVFPDTHLEYQDRRTLNAVMNFTEQHKSKWDYFIQLGDLLDLDFISKFSKKDITLRANSRFKQSFNIGNRFLSDMDSILPAHCQKVILEGNHDFRIKRYLEEFPSLRGTLEYENAMDFSKYGVSYVPYWETGESVDIGHAKFIHGLYLNEYHGKKHALEYGTNIFYGHTHDMASHPMKFAGNDRTIVGQSLGFLAKYNLPGSDNFRPNKWQQGFGEFSFSSDGYFNYYPIRIFKHKFISPDGQLYAG